MAFSTATITFNQDLVLDDIVWINATFFINIKETWVNVRSGPGQVSIGTPTGTAGERTAINYLQALELDFGHIPAFSFSRVGNVVTISSDGVLVNFVSVQEKPASVDIVIDNTGNEALFYFTNTVISAATTNDVCTHAKVTITSSILASKINSPVVVENNTNNPFSFEVLRGISIPVSAESAGGQVVNQSLLPIGIINSSTIEISVSANPSGASVTVSVLQSELLTLEFSLDNTNFQTSPIFPSLPPGDYTVWVRDQLGCKSSKVFSVDAIGLLSSYFRMSQSNSFRFANRITHGDCSNYKNDENTLSCEEDVLKPYRYVQDFQSCDIITTQFRSNYATLTAAVRVVETGAITGFTVEKKTDNIGRKDRRDAIKYGLATGGTGVYFTAGNTYDYETGVDNGDYVLNGSRPDWGVAGNYFLMEGIWYLIENIIYDEDKNAEVLHIPDLVSPTNDTVVQVRSIYNIETYEEYEFIIDLAPFLGKVIEVILQNNDFAFDDLTHITEWIDVKVRQKNTVEIQYSNRSNTDMNFSRGLVNKLRIPLELKSAKPIGDSETLKTDTSALLLSSDVYQVIVYEFQPVTTGMMWKLVQALSHSNVKMDGVDVVKESDFEVEGPLEDTNLYIVKASMIKANSVYNSDSGVLGFGEGSLEIPALIDGGSEFMKYQ